MATSETKKISEIFRIAVASWLRWLPSRDLSRVHWFRKGSQLAPLAPSRNFIMRSQKTIEIFRKGSQLAPLAPIFSRLSFVPFTRICNNLRYVLYKYILNILFICNIICDIRMIFPSLLITRLYKDPLALDTWFLELMQNWLYRVRNVQNVFNKRVDQINHHFRTCLRITWYICWIWQYTTKPIECEI